MSLWVAKVFNIYRDLFIYCSTNLLQFYCTSPNLFSFMNNLHPISKYTSKGLLVLSNQPQGKPIINKIHSKIACILSKWLLTCGQLNNKIAKMVVLISYALVDPLQSFSKAHKTQTVHSIEL